VASGLWPLALVALLASAQRGIQNYEAEVTYNGGFTFTRIRYGGPGFRGRGGSSWSHDYPNADIHLPKIIEYLSTIPINVDASNVFTLDDPEIFRHPIIYLSEPGYWSITDSEASNLRKYLLKGGFLILDDFEAEQWYNMEEQVRRALPDHEFIEIGPEHPIFSSFFRLKDIYVPHPLVRVTPKYFAMFENNNPNGRLMVLANWNSDLAEYWEWSDQVTFMPVDLTNEAYKLGVNYIFYGLTH